MSFGGTILTTLSTAVTSNSPGIIGAAGLSSSYDGVLSALLQTLIFLANVAGGLVVGVATVRGLLTYTGELIRTRGGDVPKEGIRLSLGRSLALALEFQLGADILATALNPTKKDVTVLAAIVVLRTALNYFLQRELAEAQRREAAANLGTARNQDVSMENAG